MTTIAILPILNNHGDKVYCAVAGNQQFTGKTAGQALDALTEQLGENDFSALLFIRDFHPDQFFTDQQRNRLAELMALWRTARDYGENFPENLQLELEKLIESELHAATLRSVSMMASMKL